VVSVCGGDEFEFFSPVFNIADASISIGVIALFLFQKRFVKKLPEKKKNYLLSLTRNAERLTLNAERLKPKTKSNFSNCHLHIQFPHYYFHYSSTFATLHRVSIQNIICKGMILIDYSLIYYTRPGRFPISEGAVFLYVYVQFILT